MITRFGSLYAGAVDLDDYGYEATPVNDRWLSDERLNTVYEKAEAIAKLMDRSGYSTFWMAEHHFQREGYECIPNVLMMAVHLTHLTTRLKIGCGFNIAPMWHPVRLAEDYAMADILTKGRVVFGVGRGYHTREVEVFGAPMLDQDANRELFEEQVELILKAFNQRAFSHQGKHYTVPPPVPYRGYNVQEITLVPRPITRPVDCYQPIVSASPRGLDFMARNGMKGIMGGGAAIGGGSERTAVAWRDALARNGRETELGGDLIVGLTVHIADSQEAGIREATPYYEEWVKMFAPLGFVRGLNEAQVAAAASPATARTGNLPTMQDQIASGAWLVGSPEQIAEQIADIQDRWPGLQEVNIGHPVGMPKAIVLEQLERFAQEVMPKFTRQPVAAG
ncbi:MAG: LLM class flavin-dependent oxidoreductase [Chloroflexi bacterium]|nr:LLM class flavin-dependent oxidoreductase [Chloroflexota bacterium]